jgi:hypothetical protein
VLGTRVVAMSPGRHGFSGEVSLASDEARDPLGTEFSRLKHDLFMMVSGDTAAAGAFLE